MSHAAIVGKTLDNLLFRFRCHLLVVPAYCSFQRREEALFDAIREIGNEHEHRTWANTLVTFTHGDTGVVTDWYNLAYQTLYNVHLEPVPTVATGLDKPAKSHPNDDDDDDERPVTTGLARKTKMVTVFQ